MLRRISLSKTLPLLFFKRDLIAFTANTDNVITIDIKTAITMSAKVECAVEIALEMAVVVVANIVNIAAVVVGAVGIILVVEVIVATVDFLGTVVVIFVTVVLVLWTVAVHIEDDIDPGEPVNISLFVAFEVNQETPHSFWLKDCA